MTWCPLEGGWLWLVPHCPFIFSGRGIGLAARFHDQIRSWLQVELTLLGFSRTCQHLGRGAKTHHENNVTLGSYLVHRSLLLSLLPFCRFRRVFIKAMNKHMLLFDTHDLTELSSERMFLISDMERNDVSDTERNLGSP